jgi:antagonist of KipI
MIEVLKAPPFATVQDLGWRTGRAMGLPQGGAMDRALLQETNSGAGNAPGAAALEWALGPGSLRFERDTMVCVLEDAEVRIDGEALGRGAMRVASRAMRVAAGAVVEIVPGRRDRFVYVAVGGGIDVAPMLGSRSTYLPGGLGGFEGRRIKTGDRLPIGAAEGVIAGPQRTGAADGVIARPQRGRGDPAAELILGVTRGPQWERFDEAARAEFFAGSYTVTTASDRMGYRLQGPAVRPRERATLPSEAACPGAVQIPDDGQPIVLMPDGPTVGGYPKLAVVVGVDLGKLAQCQPGRVVRFREVSLRIVPREAST